MLGQWAPAYQAYHAAKREYSADGAWLLYAGALEMAALAAFMANEASRKTFDYMEESIITYMNSCRCVILNIASDDLFCHRLIHVCMYYPFSIISHFVLCTYM